MFSSWITVAILAGLGSNLGSFFFRLILKDRDDPTAYAWLFELMRLCIFAVFCFSGFRLVLDAPSLLALIGLGVSEFVSVFFMMKMHAFSHLSVSTIILRTRLIWIPIIAYFTFGESLKLFEYAGIGVLLLGLCVATSPKKWIVDRGMTFAYITGFTSALVNIFLKLASPAASTPVVMVFMSLPSVICFPVFMNRSSKRIHESVRTHLPSKLFSGVLSAVSVYLLAVAVSLGPVSKVSAIYQGMMVVAIIAGIIFLNERQDVGRKLIGSAITMVGVMLLTMKE